MGLLKRLVSWTNRRKIGPVAAEVARRSLIAVAERVLNQIQGMTVPEARGYIRARAGSVIESEARLLLGESAKSLSENRPDKGDSPILLGGARKVGTVPAGSRIGSKFEPAVRARVIDEAMERVIERLIGQRMAWRPAPNFKRQAA